MVEEEKEDSNTGATCSMWLKKDVIRELDRKSKELGHSKSFLVNLVLREKLGLPPDQEFKGSDKL